MTDTRTGGCLCGAVRFTARLTKTQFGACHCEMCRRWTGSALLGLTVPTGNIDWQGEDHVATRQTSPWAMRAWCRECGSNLYFRVTADGTQASLAHVAALRELGCAILGEDKRVKKGSLAIVFRAPQGVGRPELERRLAELPDEVRGTISWEQS